MSGERVGDFLVRADGDGVDDHAAFTAFDAIDLLGLALDRHVAVDEADAALLGERDGKVGFGDGIHRGTDDGDVERDFAGKPGAAVGLAREDFAACRDEEHIVEGETFGNRVLNHGVHTSLS